MPTDLPESPSRLPETPERNPSPLGSSNEPGGGAEPPLRRPAPRPPDDGGAFRIATVSGIPIRLHWTFLALLVWIGAGSLFTRGRAGENAALWNILYVVALFACVVLHELGHALTAQRYGVRTRDIVLYPIGGIASLESMPRPRQELWIALAGPAVNVVIAAILYGILRVAGMPVEGSFRTLGTGGFLASLMWTNVWLALFNMLPAFPMDGGRVLRALIARTTTEDRATQIAASVGRLLAIGMGVYAVFSGTWLLLFIALFVYTGAGQEAAAFRTKSLLTGHRVSEAMIREFHTLAVGTTLREAADALLAGSQQDFPVVHGEEVVGVLSRSALMRGFATEGPDSYVAGAMERDFAWTKPSDDLENVLSQIAALQNGPILVMEGENRENARLVGMITQENLLEFLTLTQLRDRLQQPRQ